MLPAQGFPNAIVAAFQQVTEEMVECAPVNLVNSPSLVIESNRGHNKKHWSVWEKKFFESYFPNFEELIETKVLKIASPWPGYYQFNYDKAK